MSKIPVILTKYFSGKLMPVRSGFYTLCLTLFLMPFPRSWSLYPMGVTLFFGIISWIADIGNCIILFKRRLIIILPLILYFIIYATGLIFDKNLVNVVDKLMFILVPVLAFPVFISDFFLKNIRIVLLSFVSGILVICIFQFLRAFYESISFIDGIISFESQITPGVSRFNWEQLSTFEHPTYTAIKTLWAFTLVLFTGKILKINVVLQIFLIILFSLFLYFLAVRSELLILSLVVIIYIFSRLKTLTAKIVFSLLIPVLFLTLFRIANTNERINYWYDHVYQKIFIEKVEWKDIEPRTRSWFCSMNLIREKPLFGVGLNARDKLSEEHRRNNFNVEADIKLNSHNQFLETQLTFGIPGTIILLWMLLIPLIKRKKMWNPDLEIPFLIIICVSMIFESILVRQWGIMFFVLFYCILTIPERTIPE